jgi:hypothetical protein
MVPGPVFFVPFVFFVVEDVFVPFVVRIRT